MDTPTSPAQPGDAPPRPAPPKTMVTDPPIPFSDGDTDWFSVAAATKCLRWLYANRPQSFSEMVSRGLLGIEPDTPKRGRPAQNGGN